MGKITLSALCIISIMTHVSGINFDSHLENIIAIFVNGVSSEDAMVQKETSRAIGDFANVLPENNEVQAKLF